MHGTGAAPLVPMPLGRIELQQTQDIPHRDLLAEHVEV
jgi:hypothetical protein